jgi:hypothetical protein
MNQPMQILLAHITRMTYPRICLAGIEIQTGIHIRPITGRKDILDFSLLEHFQLGTIIDLGWYAPRPTPPEVEDCFFKPSSVQFIEKLLPPTFWSMLDAVAVNSLTDIFENHLVEHGTTMYVNPNTGMASLGELRVEKARLVLHPDSQKLRLRFRVPTQELSLPVTDLRFFIVKNDTYVPAIETIKWVNHELQSSSLILSLGLSRAWSNNAEPARHWLQVNGLHLANYPLWETLF